MKKTICILAFFLMLFVFQCSKGTVDRNDISSYLPASNELKDWQPVGQPQKFEGEDLYLYIDGGAEIYYEYGFTQVITQEYRNEIDKTINLEIYEMEIPAGAYGIYTFKTDDTGQKIAIGNDGFLEEYYLNFWKGRFLVTVTGFDPEKETVDGLMTIAKVTEAKIKDKGRKPLLPELLPQKDLKENSIKYLKGNLGLFNQYVFDAKNIFGLSEGVMGQYGHFKAFVFRYDDEEVSLKWYENARNHLENSPGFHDFAKLDSSFSMMDKEGQPVVVELYQNYVFIILGKEQIDAESFIDEMKDRIKKDGKSD